MSCCPWIILDVVSTTGRGGFVTCSGLWNNIKTHSTHMICLATRGGEADTQIPDYLLFGKDSRFWAVLSGLECLRVNSPWDHWEGILGAAKNIGLSWRSWGCPATQKLSHKVTYCLCNIHHGLCYYVYKAYVTYKWFLTLALCLNQLGELL